MNTTEIFDNLGTFYKMVQVYDPSRQCLIIPSNIMVSKDSTMIELNKEDTKNDVTVTVSARVMYNQPGTYHTYKTTIPRLRKNKIYDLVWQNIKTVGRLFL